MKTSNKKEKMPETMFAAKEPDGDSMRILFVKEVKKSPAQIVRNMKRKASKYIEKQEKVKEYDFKRLFEQLKDRCENKEYPRYRNYGGRGIKIEWKDWEEFKKDMEDSYYHHAEIYGIDNTSLDRINNDGNYSKENCRWSTWREQNLNRRDTKFIELVYVEDALGTSDASFRSRLKKFGPEIALNLAVQEMIYKVFSKTLRKTLEENTSSITNNDESK